MRDQVVLNETVEIQMNAEVEVRLPATVERIDRWLVVIATDEWPTGHWRGDNA